MAERDLGPDDAFFKGMTEKYDGAGSQVGRARPKVSNHAPGLAFSADQGATSKVIGTTRRLRRRCISCVECRIAQSQNERAP